MAVSYNFAGPRIVKDGLVLYLDAGNPNSYNLSTPNTWRDISKRGNNGSLINGPVFDSANEGSIVFDGTNDIVNTSYVSPNTYTFCAWFRTDVVSSGYKNIISIRTPNYSLLLLDDNTPNLGFWTNDGLGGGALSTPTIQINTWYNVAFVRAGNNLSGGYKAYLNSISYGSANTGNWSTTATLHVGGRTDSTQFFNGNIAQVQIYNRALSQAEITQNFQATRGRFGI
jgi:hypothetical protein